MKNEKKEDFLTKANLLMTLKGYKKVGSDKTQDAINIRVTQPDSDKIALIHIITRSNLKSYSIGVDQVREAEKILKAKNIDKIILFGKRFTKAAKETLTDRDIEFFSEKKKILSSLNSKELYLKLREHLDTLCKLKCGQIPQSESECKGFDKGPVPCLYCDGNGRLEGLYPCPTCGGVGSRNNHYSCEIRLISENADYHFEKGWGLLLQHDLFSLLKVLYQSEKQVSEPSSMVKSPLITTRE